MRGAPYLPGFGRCGIPRLSAGHSQLATDLHVHGHLHPVLSGAEVRGIPHLPKPGRYPYFLYAVPKSTTCAAFIKESRMEFLEANQLHRKYEVWGTRHSLRTAEPGPGNQAFWNIQSLLLSA